MKKAAVFGIIVSLGIWPLSNNFAALSGSFTASGGHISGTTNVDNADKTGKEERKVSIYYDVDGAYIQHLNKDAKKDPAITDRNTLFDDSRVGILTPNEMYLRTRDKNGVDTSYIYLTNKTGSINASGKVSASGFDAKNEKLTNLANGEISKVSKDGINGSQLFGLMDKLGINLEFDGDNNITNLNINPNSVIGGNAADEIPNIKLAVDSLDKKVDALDNRVNQSVGAVGANAAALVALKPLPYSIRDKWSIALGLGHYKTQSSIALGAFYTPNRKFSLNIGASLTQAGDKMYSLGVSFRIGKGSDETVKFSRLELEEQNALLKQEVTESRKLIEQLMMRVENLEKAK